MEADAVVRQQLVNLLMLRQAHMIFEDAVKDFPDTAMNIKPQHSVYSFWHILEHIRICQWDILDYIVNPDYVAPDFPSGLWRGQDETCSQAQWDATISQFYDDRQALVDIINDPQRDLYAQIPHGATGHNIMREIMIVGQHNAYHIGEFGILRTVCDLW